MTTLYALDIEVDNTEGMGLRADRSRVTEVAVHSAATSLYLRADTAAAEPVLLAGLEAHLQALPAGVVVTWNGANFDLPFLAHRYAACNVATGLRLQATDLRPPKYPRNPDPTAANGWRLTPGHDGGYLARWGAHGHADICYPYEQVAADAGIVWSLKPVAAHVGIDMFQIARESVHDYTVAERVAYNVSDAIGTYLLADGLDTLPVDPAS